MQAIRLTMGLLLLGAAAAQMENARVGFIDFYGRSDLDPQKLRAALTVRRGDRLTWPGTRDQIQEEVTKHVGRPFTHFAPVCCDEDGRWMLYIGLGGTPSGAGRRPKLMGDAKLTPGLVALYDESMAMLPEALKYSAGMAEDYSKGYSLSSYPPMRAIQLRMREGALAHEEELLRVLVEAAEDRQRIAASALCGYIRQSTRQIDSLQQASNDANETVRNNATRALAVLASTPAVARQIPALPFIASLQSSVWSDRNKGLMLLTFLTRDRNPEVLAALKAQALPSLMEMARWQNPGHSAGPIRLLGRIAGIDESELDRLTEKGTAGPVLAAIEKMR